MSVQKKLLATFVLLTNLIYAQHQVSTKLQKTQKEEKDKWGRLVKDAAGKQINYTQAQSFLNKDLTTTERKSSPPTIQSQSAVSCSNIWNFTVMGSYIGSRSLATLDIDHDGKVETIASAASAGYYFYTIQYNLLKNDYEQSWTSSVYNDQITFIRCADVNNDSIYEIFVGFSTGKIIEYDGASKNVIRTFSIPGGSFGTVYGISDIEFGDADNDGVKELVVSDENKFYFFDVTAFNLYSTISTYGAYDFKIGNTDNDAANEIITSTGYMLQCNGTAITNEWTFESSASTSNIGYVQLSDIDHDGKKEIFKADAWTYIYAYDGDTKTLKYTITTPQDIAALLLVDINNDNTDELIFGDGQWGSLHCYNSITHAQMWSIANPNHGVTQINIANTDADADLEVLWGAGQTSSGGDTLYVYDCTTKLGKWKSKDIDGPFDGIEISDVDNDGALELITVSYQSESSYGSGIISVFDANTHNLEWQCNGEYLSSTWTGVWDVKVADVDNDGVKEIVVAASDDYTGKIWIIDGITKSIKKQHEYSTENLSSFYTLDIADVDNDGNLEIITVNDKVRVINPADFSVKWSSAINGLASASKVVVENVDADANKEIIVVKRYFNSDTICVIDGLTQQQLKWKGTFTAFDLYDMNHDNIKDIVYGLSTGGLGVIYPITNQTVSLGQGSANQIDGIKVGTILATDTSPTICFTSAGILYYKNTSVAQIASTGTITAGVNNGLKLVDVDNDGNKELFVGTRNSVYELSSSCYKCTSLKDTLLATNISCLSNNDAQVSTTITGGTPPYNYLWSTGSTAATITNLDSGLYNLTVYDHASCSITNAVYVKKSGKPSATASIINVSCDNINKGVATISINQGTAPYSYSWSNGYSYAKDSLLNTGTYTVMVTDALHCKDTVAFTISKDSLIVSAYKHNLVCYGEATGYFEAYVTKGTPPYNFQWSTGANYYYAGNLKSGTYTLTTQDGTGCIVKDTFSLTQPSKIAVSIITNPDDPSTTLGEGSATASISGGTAPYYLNWNDANMQTTPTAFALQTGNYMLVVRDHNYCLDTAKFAIVNFSDNMNVFPNPTVDAFTLQVGNADPASLNIINELGQEVYKVDKFTRSITISTVNLATGSYLLHVFQIGNEQTLRLLVNKRP